MLFLGLGRAVHILLMILIIKVSTTLISPYEMGRLSLIYAIISFYILVFLYPVGMFMNRRLHSWDLVGKVKFYMKYFWIYLLLVSLFAAMSIFILAKLNLLIISGNLTFLIAIVSGSLLITTTNQVVIPNLNLLGYRALFMSLTLATSSASLIFAYFIVIHSYPKAEYWLSGILAGQFLVTIIAWKFFYGNINNTNELVPDSFLTKKHLRQIMSFVVPILVGSGFMWFQTQGYRLFIVQMADLADLGLFFAGYSISSGIVSSVEAILSTYFLPLFYKNITSNKKNAQEEAWKFYASGMFPTLILVGFFTFATAPELTKIFLGAGYKNSSVFLVWGSIAEILRVISGVFSMVAHAKMETKLMIFPSILGSLVLILLVMFVLPYWGVSGLGPLLSIAWATLCISTFYAVRKNFIFLLPYKLIGICFFFGMLLAFLNYFFRNIIDLSYILVLVISIIIYLAIQYVVLRPHLKNAFNV